MMNANQPQGPYPPPFPPQQQNGAQVRPVANMQQPIQGQGQGQQKMQQQMQNPYANFDPQVAMFLLEKPKNAESWEDVEPEQLHVSLQAVQAELNKFKRNHGSVKREMNQIPSANCRRLINELVEEKTKELWLYNKSLQYRIAAVETEWKDLSRRHRQIKKVVVILETEPSGFQDQMQMKQGQAGGMKPNNMQNQQFPGQQNMQQGMPKVNNAQPHMQQMGQGQQGGMQMPNPPPPPPPPVMQGQPGMQVPLPPNPNMMNGGQPMMQNPNIQNMSQGYPMGQGNMHHMDPMMWKGEKSRRHRDRRGRDSTDDDDWESTSDEDDDEPIIIEHGDFDGRRGRSRHPSKFKKVHLSRSRPRSRSQSRNRNRSRSQSRNRRVFNYSGQSTKRRRDSVIIDPLTGGRYSPRMSPEHSPRGSRHKIPPIQINVNSDPKKSHKINHSTPMSRESSWGSASGSGTASFTNSSTYTAEDPVFDQPLRSAMRNGRGQRHQSWSSTHQHPHHSQIYDLDLDHRPKFRHVRANDYPHQQRMRDPYFESQRYSRPGMVRRSTVAGLPGSNPFTPTDYHHQSVRPGQYPSEQGYTFPAPRTIGADPNSIQLDELAEAIEHIQDTKRHAPLRRSFTGGARYDGDEWDIRMPSTRGPGVYQGYN